MLEKVKPLVSVIVPIYKIDKKYLTNCLDSLLSQEGETGIEIICVDDNNYDDPSGLIIDEYASLYENIVALHQINSGVSTARNLGLSVARGEWIMFVDPDDWCEPNIIDTLVKHIEDSTDIIACSCYVNYSIKEIVNHFFDDFSRVTLAIDKDIMQLQLIARGFSKYFPPEIGFGVPWAKLYRKKMLDDNNLRFDPKLKRMQDNIFNLYAIQVSKDIIYIKKPLYHYRKESNSASNKFMPDVVKSYEMVLNATSQFIEKCNKSDLFRRALNVKKIISFNSYLNQYYLHEKNTMPWKEKKIQVLNLISNDFYREALENVKMSDLTIKEKAFYLSLKTKNLSVTKFLFKMEYMLRKIKNGKMNN